MPDSLSYQVVRTTTGFTFAGSFSGSTMDDVIASLKGGLSVMWCCVFYSFVTIRWSAVLHCVFSRSCCFLGINSATITANTIIGSFKLIKFYTEIRYINRCKKTLEDYFFLSSSVDSYPKDE